ncbi:tail fiber protein [Edwardsiella anguillarum]|uniref:phage tail protein n=1 Tax=Edwardsiella anguillarum TaxID=1821960 RepID=UPI0024B85FAB|nr:phage tail protein [Edwardsiella anguillarum]WHQ26734.1 phage tail protein [Edwardsiella anguillarum]
MYFLDNNSGIATMPPLSAAQSTTPRWFSEGDGSKGISWPGQDWFNIVQAELLAILNVAGLRPDKSKLNQLALAIKVIVGNEALLKNNCLSEIAQAGAAAQKKARDALGLGALATKDSLGPVDVNALAKNQNLKDVPSKAEARKALELGNSATRNVGTTSGTVAAGDDGRITGSMQKNQNGADIPDKARFINNLGLRETINQAAGALQKAQNGADIPNKDKFTQTIGAGRAFGGSISTGAGNWTTAQFIDWLASQGAFGHPYWMCKGSWSYGNNRLITDTGCGNIHLSGAVIEVMGVRSAMTIRVTTPTTSSGGGTANAQFTYINHGSDYSPGWRRDYNTRNPQAAFALGRTGDTAATDKGIAWNAPSGVYQANVTGASCMILHFNMGVGSCPAVQFKVNYRNGGIAYRSARDRVGFENDWVELMPATKTVQDIRLSTREQAQLWNGPGFGDQPPYVITGVLNSNRDELADTIYRRAFQKLVNGTWYNVGGL